MLDNEPTDETLGAGNGANVDGAGVDGGSTDNAGALRRTRRRRASTVDASAGEKAATPRRRSARDAATAAAHDELGQPAAADAVRAGAGAAKQAGLSTPLNRRVSDDDAESSGADTKKADIRPDSSTSAVEPVATTAEQPTRRTRRRTTARTDPAFADAPTPAVVVATGPDEPIPDAVPTAQPEPAERSAERRRAAALTAPAILFMAPQTDDTSDLAHGDLEGLSAEKPTGLRRRRLRRTAELPEPEPAALQPAKPQMAEETEPVSGGRRRRRRGRRGRGRGRGQNGEELVVQSDEPAADAEEEPADTEETGEEAVTVTRRRRRRRRSGAVDTGPIEDDGVPTVVKIRPARQPADEVQGVAGSTRLEAKRQRRRDGRDQRRTRPPILTESEFLARRESVDRQMVVRQTADRTQIAVLEDGVLVEHYVARASSTTMAGNVYLGKVQNVLPSMEAAFIDIGRGRNAVLYAGEVNWDASGLEGKARSIEQALRSGDSVLVQVTKDPVGHKGARLTSHIALSGRHLVYVPNGTASGISRKLSDTERKRLREVLKRLVPDGAGVIVRTAAEGATEDELSRDVKRLQAQWEDICDKAAKATAPALLYEEPDLLIRVVRDLFNEDFRELLIQGDDAYDMVEGYLSHVSPDLVGRVRRYTGVTDVFAQLRIDEQLIKGLDRKVYLPSGGHLVIDRTEAMTVIDVNTGKYTGAGGNLEETVTRNNLEAAEEIVRQLRLRDVGGIVVIDFIDMVLESNRELVLRRLTECLGRDRTKHQVTEITSLGLVQMTRKRIGQGLLEAFSETCEACKGRGLIVHTEPLAGARASASARAAAPARPTRKPEPTNGYAEPPVAEYGVEPVVEPVVGTPAGEVGLPDDNGGLADLVVEDAEIADADDIDESEEAEPLLASARRRARRGGVRRRTRP